MTYPELRNACDPLRTPGYDQPCGLWDVLSKYQVAVGCIKAVSGGCGMY